MTEMTTSEPFPSFVSFTRESNLIEGIDRDPTDAEVEAHIRLVDLNHITIPGLIGFVSVVQPDAVLRDEPGLDVRVGRHVPMPGGPEMMEAFFDLLQRANSVDSYEIHCEYESLHPFTDGNGRSGRALWLWMECRTGVFPTRGFLHTWYYQSLQHHDRRE